MKKVATKTLEKEKEIRSEYDFSSMKGAERGKYYKAYRADSSITGFEALWKDLLLQRPSSLSLYYFFDLRALRPFPFSGLRSDVYCLTV